MSVLSQSIYEQRQPRRGKDGFCLRGHPRTPENLYSQGECKLCRKQLREYIRPIGITGEEIAKYLKEARELR